MIHYNIHYEDLVSKTPDALVVHLTPELASEILKHNNNNRSISRCNLLQITNSIKNNSYLLNGEAIIIDSDGMLLDGQHRLYAIINTGVAIDTTVSIGMPPKSYKTIDVGRKRSGGDVLAMNNVPSPKNASALIASYFAYRRGLTIAASRPNRYSDSLATPDAILHFYLQYPSLVDDVVVSARKCIEKRAYLSASKVGAYILYLILDKRHSKDAVYSFFYQVFRIEPSTNITIDLLSEALERNKMNQTKLTGAQIEAYIIKSWNCFVTGKELKQLRYSTNETPISFN